MSLNVPQNKEYYYGLWSHYGKSPISWENMRPKDRSDFRIRVRRETLLGKITVFHKNIENYCIRQVKAYSTTRILILWSISYIYFTKRKYYYPKYLDALFAVYTFKDFHKYTHFTSIPNVIKLGNAWSYFYVLRPIISKYYQLN